VGRPAELTHNVTPEARAAVASRDERPIASIGGDTRLARALLLERVGARRAARRQLLTLLIRPPRDRMVKAAKRLRTIDVYAGALWTKPLLWWCGGRLRNTAPLKLRLRLDRWHVTILSSHLGRHDAALARARRAMQRCGKSLPPLRTSAPARVHRPPTHSTTVSAANPDAMSSSCHDGEGAGWSARPLKSLPRVKRPAQLREPSPTSISPSSTTAVNPTGRTAALHHTGVWRRWRAISGTIDRSVNSRHPRSRVTLTRGRFRTRGSGRYTLGRVARVQTYADDV
jgi:hypothetical protein